MQKKRVLSLLLSMIVCIAMMPMAVFADEEGIAAAKQAVPEGIWTDYAAVGFAGGAGTEAEPYQIETAEQLALLAKDINSWIGGKEHVNEYFILTADIDLSAHRWIPIGSGSHSTSNTGNGSFTSFGGYFDGNGKKITGLYVDESSEKNSAGFFGNITGYIIENLTIENAYVKTEAIPDAQNDNQILDAAGILIGNAAEGYGMSTSIKNCTVSGTVESKTAMTGGLAGYNSYGSYENCTANVNIIGGGKAGGFVGEDFSGTYSKCTAKGDVSGKWSVGGFAGVIWWESKAEKCAAYGKVEATDWNVGGFAGYIGSNVQIKNCASLSDVTSTVTEWEPKIGGFAGTNKSSTISSSHAAGKITASSKDHAAGGFIGFDAGGTASGCSFDSVKNLNMQGVGETGTEGTNDISGLKTQEVLANICNDYHGGHSIIKVEAKDATTTAAGNREHWKCENCGALYSDENGTTEISEEEVTIPKKSGHYVPVQKPEIVAGEGGKTSLENSGRTLVITPDDGMEISKVTVNGKGVTVTDNKLTGLKTGDKVEVTFAKIPPTKEETDKAFKEKALKLELTVRTSKTAKKNIKAVVKETPEIKDFIKELDAAGYTVKYKFYRSDRKSSKYVSMITKTENTYTNTTGKKDAKYYYKAKLMIYDNEGSLTAQTELKQCRYGKRIWTR